MPVTEEQVALVRARCAVTEEEYSDESLAAYIGRYPLYDLRGQGPVTIDPTTTPPSVSDNDFWIPTYDINAACADIWEEKAALLAGQFDFSSDDQRFQRSQRWDQAMKMVRYYRSKRAPQSMYVHGLSAAMNQFGNITYVINFAEPEP